MESISVRKENTDTLGNRFSNELIQSVWEKAKFIDNMFFHPNAYRQDKCGNTMEYNQYGNRSSNTGWEIDHIKPVAHGGSDEISNLQPLTWKNNLDKGDDLNWSCPVRSTW